MILRPPISFILIGANILTFILWITFMSKWVNRSPCSNTPVFTQNNNTEVDKDKYKSYNNQDFYNKYDLLDQYGEKIIIYSNDLENCYKTCEKLINCDGFARFRNYCYLKYKYDIKDIIKKDNVTLFLAIK